MEPVPAMALALEHSGVVAVSTLKTSTALLTQVRQGGHPLVWIHWAEPLWYVCPAGEATDTPQDLSLIHI